MIMRYRVSTPDPEFTGNVAGVHFVDGEATVDSQQQLGAYQFFRRHDYQMEEADSKPSKTKGAAKAAKAEGGGGERTMPERPSKNASKADWAGYATAALGLTEADADAKTRDELVQLADKHDEETSQ